MNDIYHTQLVGEDALRLAIALIAKEYEKEGYLEKDVPIEESSITRYLKMPRAATFGAYDGTRLIGTVSLVPDSSGGVPLDAIWKEEADELRRKGSIAEVCQLVVDRSISEEVGGKQKRQKVLLPLFQKVLDHALTEEVDYLVISVHEKHHLFYDALGFKTMGPLKYYTSVNNQPAYAKYLDMKHLDDLSIGKLMRSFFLRK